MSSLRNAVSRRPHKERSQPASRTKWGLLEKHKDYSLRAKDYNAKKQKLKLLERKVKEKHPDEFAYGMVKRERGKHGDGRSDGEGRLGHDAVKLLKTQDMGYLKVMMARGRRELGRVREELGVGAGGVEGGGRKVVFEEEEVVVAVVEGENGVGEKRGKKRKSDGEVVNGVEASAPDVLPAVQNVDVDGVAMSEDEEDKPVKPKSAKSILLEKNASARLRTERKRRARLQEVRTNKLEMLKRRQKEIMAAADQLDLQRAKMAKTIGGVNKNGVKFKIRERKR